MNKLRTLFVMAALVIAGAAMGQEKPYLTVDDITIGQGAEEEDILVVKMESDEPMASCNFQLYLPDGVDLIYDEDEDAYLASDATDLILKSYTKSVSPREGYYLINIYPATLRNFKAASGVLIKFALKTTSTVTGTLEASLKNIGISDIDAVSINQGKIPDVSFKINISTTGIKSAAQDGADDALYDLQGRRVTNPQKGGVYVKKGKKVVK